MFVLFSWVGYILPANRYMNQIPLPIEILGTNITEANFSGRLSREISDKYKSHERDDQFNHLLII